MSRRILVDVKLLSMAPLMTHLEVPKAAQVKYNFLLSKGNNIGNILTPVRDEGRDLLPLVAMVTYLDVPKAVQVKYNFLLSKGNNIGHHLVILSHQSGRELLASTNGS